MSCLFWLGASWAVFLAGYLCGSVARSAKTADVELQHLYLSAAVQCFAEKYASKPEGELITILLDDVRRLKAAAS